MNYKDISINCIIFSECKIEEVVFLIWEMPLVSQVTVFLCLSDYVSLLHVFSVVITALSHLLMK